MAEQLDAIDLSVIRELQRDPRATVLGMAGRIGSSRQVVQQRLGRLMDERILRVCGLVDPALLGRPLLAKLRISLLHSVHAVAEALALDPRTHWVTLLASGDEIIVTVSVALPGDLSAFVDEVVRTQSGVDRVVVDLITAVFTPAPDGEAEEPWLGGGTQGSFDEVDMAIIAELRADGRAPFTRLGEVTGLSTASARQRALRLIESGTVRLRALADPDALGLVARAEVHIQVREDSTGVARRIAALPHANYVCRTVGARDIHAEFYCRDDEQLLTAVAALRDLPEVGDWDFYRYAEVIFANPLWA
jgi:DNA-binding Lrp family transcriptional regulator